MSKFRVYCLFPPYCPGFAAEKVSNILDEFDFDDVIHNVDKMKRKVVSTMRQTLPADSYDIKVVIANKPPWYCNVTVSDK